MAEECLFCRWRGYHFLHVLNVCFVCVICVYCKRDKLFCRCTSRESSPCSNPHRISIHNTINSWSTWIQWCVYIHVYACFSLLYLTHVFLHIKVTYCNYDECSTIHPCFKFFFGWFNAHCNKISPYGTGGRLLLTANFKVTVT